MNIEGLIPMEPKKVNIQCPTKAEKSTIVYFDKDGNVVDKENGCQVQIVEYDLEGNRINEIWGSYTPENKEEKIR